MAPVYYLGCLDCHSFIEVGKHIFIPPNNIELIDWLRRHSGSRIEFTDDEVETFMTWEAEGWDCANSTLT